MRILGKEKFGSEVTWTPVGVSAQGGARTANRVDPGKEAVGRRSILKNTRHDITNLGEFN